VRSSCGKRLLLVDDESSIRQTLPPILRKYGYSVETAGTVSGGLERLHAEKFDLLICDLNIEKPGDGLTVIQAIRKVNPQCVTIVLTGYPDLDTAIEGIKLSIDDYVIKPSNADTLVALLAEKLAKRRPTARILSVSYYEPVLRTWALLLEARHYETVCASRLESAIECCKGPSVDILVLGSSVPLTDKQLIIAAFRESSTAPVISVPLAENDLTDGADYHIEPDPDALLELIDKLTQRKVAPGKERELRQTPSSESKTLPYC